MKASQKLITLTIILTICLTIALIPNIQAQPLSYSGNTKDITYKSYSPGWVMRDDDPTRLYQPNNPGEEPFIFYGTVNPSGLYSEGPLINGAAAFGLLDKVAVEDNHNLYGWFGGAYICFERDGENLKVGPSDGADFSPPVVGEYKTYEGYFSDPPVYPSGSPEIEFVASIHLNKVEVKIGAETFSEDYGAIKTADHENPYGNKEFEFGAYFGIDCRGPLNNVLYEIFIGQPETESLEIDVKPDTTQNNINTKSKGKIPIAILGSLYFDVSTIDPSSINIEGKNPIHWGYEDVNWDGFEDMILHFNTQDLIEVLNPEDNAVTITATLTSGEQISGSDSIKMK